MRKAYFRRIKAALRSAAGMLVVGVVAAQMCHSCVRDELDVPAPPAQGDVRITLTIEVPGGRQTASGSRAMPADEGTVSEVHVLLFRPSGGPLVGAYPAVGAIETDPGNPAKKSFTVDVIEGRFDLMVLANSGAAVTAASLARDMSRSEVGNRLWAEQTGKFDVTGSALFPFWGQLNNAVITDGATLGEIPVLRAMARIDVVLWTDEVKDAFELETVTVYHWQNRMALIPEHYDASQEVVTAATDTRSGLSATTFTYSGADITDKERITAKIYLNETPNPGEGAFPELPCLILGGQYGGQRRYYRVDFFQRDENDTRSYHHLLRNHHYELRVEKILTDGSGSEQEAYESTVVNIETGIKVWNESGMGDIIINGQWWLKVKPGEREFPKNSNRMTAARAADDPWTDNTIEIETNQPSWHIDMAAAEWTQGTPTGWIDFTPDSWQTGDPVEKVEVWLDENETGALRSITVPVVTEHIIYYLTITQTEEERVWIRITDSMDQLLSDADDLVYVSYPGQEVEARLVVEWFPAHLDLEVTIEDGEYAERVAFVDGYAIPSGKYTGGRQVFEYRLEPYGESDFDTDSRVYGRRDTYFYFTVGTITREVEITHRATDFIIDPRVHRMDLDNETGIFFNTNVEVVSINDPHGILTPASRQEILNFTTDLNSGVFYSSIARRAFPVAMPTTSAALDGKVATVTIRPKDYHQWMKEPNRAIEIEAYHLQPNSYIIEPGGSVHIPVRKAYRAWSQYPMYSQIPEGTLECAVLWQDVGNLISEVFITPEYTGKTIDSEIFVRATDREGNAVVALTVDGEIVWSWHIWVTDYDPEAPGHQYSFTEPTGVVTTTFMSRRVGALASGNTTQADRVKSQGLMYQWGRKDPFPSAADITNSASRPFTGEHPEVTYPAGLGPFTIEPRQNWNTALDSYRRTVTHPMNFITAAVNPYDWSTGDNYRYPWLWRSSSGERFKSEFDPCPEGWNVDMTPESYGRASQFFQSYTGMDFEDDFGWNHPSGMYLPGAGYIDHNGYYSEIGLNVSEFGGLSNSSQGYSAGGRFGMDLDSYGYTPLNKAAAAPVRCTRIK